MGTSQAEPRFSLRWFFVFFFVSGFCSLLYEVIWLRLAMAKFGVTSPLLSIVLSMFMAGLGLGSWASGWLIRVFKSRIGPYSLQLYALSELSIGVSALLVPAELAWGRHLLSQFSLSYSLIYYLASGSWIALTLIPWCACMGATIPFAMLAIRSYAPSESQRSFSFLYLANVLGAFLGALGPAVLVELYGFRGALRIGAGLNVLLAASAMLLARRLAEKMEPHPGANPASAPYDTSRKLLVLLFATGCTSMGAEVVWVRQFTPYTGTVVYAFALLLALYLSFTYMGSRIYRRSRHVEAGAAIWAALGLCCVLASLTADPLMPVPRALRLILGIGPLCLLMGFVTPMLIDRWSAGEPERAGRAYAINVVGCIVGPLLSGFLLLPHLAERWVLFVFALPWLVMAAIPQPRAGESSMLKRLVPFVACATVLVVMFASRGYEGRFAHHEVLRDDTATVIAMGDGMEKHLLVNGVGITILTPITKIMAHLPLAFLARPPQNALVVCFGMGTTYRSLMSWGIPVTAVELVPSVPKFFWYFHADGQDLLRSPQSHLVIDDGRAYLERTNEQFDVITLDPPPPVEAAGSSLLYSKEFYATIRQRLRPGGILQQWFPKNDNFLNASIARSLHESFPYVRVFSPLSGSGLHFLASDWPLLSRSAQDLAERMPAAAARDLVEWGPEPTPVGMFANMLGKEHPLNEVLARDPRAPALVDDRPVNEFYALRRRIWRTWRKDR